MESAIKDAHVAKAPDAERQRRWPVIFVLAVGGTLALAACSSAEPPTGRFVVARAAIAEAEMAGAGERAPADLSRARAKLAEGEAALRRRQYDEAGRYADEAAVDARLAATRARAAAAGSTLGTVREGITELERELERSGTP
jgi:hypothetical protein